MVIPLSPTSRSQPTHWAIWQERDYGPGFADADLSLVKNTKITEKMNVQFRVDAFDLLNHPNYGQPGVGF